MKDEEKPRILAKALGPFGLCCDPLGWQALNSQAIVVECKVEHRGGVTLPARTLLIGLPDWKVVFEILGHHGTSGPALAIILPLPKEEG